MRVEATGLHKSFGSVKAVDDLTFTLEPGVVTGFLGPNGSGKSTTLRLMLGLDNGPGRTLFDGKPLAEHHHPTRVVGAHLDAKFFHPNRSARDHLRMLATEAKIPNSRVDEVLGIVGLTGVAKKRPKGFSLGMGQRLALGGALLADPQVLMLDEPANGLDPQSIHWLRDFLKTYAARGKTVFVSSHLLSEMELMADHLVVIAKGRMVANEDMAAFVERASGNDVLVRVSEPARLADALVQAGATVGYEGEDGLAVQGMSVEAVGQTTFDLGLVVRTLTARRASLEASFLELTSDDQEYRTGGPAGPGPSSAVAASPPPAASTLPPPPSSADRFPPPDPGEVQR